MEVLVTSAEGVPPGCLLSLSAAGSRRQAPLVLGQKFAFGKSAAGKVAASEGTALKVDVLKIQGSTTLPVDAKLGRSLRAGAKLEDAWVADGLQGCNVEVPFPYGSKAGGMRLGLSVRPAAQQSQEEAPPTLQLGPKGRSANSAWLAAGVPQKGVSEPNKSVLQARAYLEEHGIVPFMEKLLRSLASERPADPWGYLRGMLPKTEEEEDSEEARRLRSELRALRRERGPVNKELEQLREEVADLRAKAGGQELEQLREEVMDLRVKVASQAQRLNSSKIAETTIDPNRTEAPRPPQLGSGGEVIAKLHATGATRPPLWVALPRPAVPDVLVRALRGDVGHHIFSGLSKDAPPEPEAKDLEGKSEDPTSAPPEKPSYEPGEEDATEEDHMAVARTFAESCIPAIALDQEDSVATSPMASVRNSDACSSVQEGKKLSCPSKARKKMLLGADLGAVPECRSGAMFGCAVPNLLRIQVQKALIQAHIEECLEGKLRLAAEGALGRPVSAEAALVSVAPSEIADDVMADRWVQELIMFSDDAPSDGAAPAEAEVEAMKPLQAEDEALAREAQQLLAAEASATSGQVSAVGEELQQVLGLQGTARAAAAPAAAGGAASGGAAKAPGDGDQDLHDELQKLLAQQAGSAGGEARQSQEGGLDAESTQEGGALQEELHEVLALVAPHGAEEAK